MIYNTLGNTMTISYPILIDGEASDLSQMDVSLYIECNQFSKEMDIEIEDNTITFTFEGKDQRVAGDYDIDDFIWHIAPSATDGYYTICLEDIKDEIQEVDAGFQRRLSALENADFATKDELSAVERRVTKLETIPVGLTDSKMDEIFD